MMFMILTFFVFTYKNYKDLYEILYFQAGEVGEADSEADSCLVVAATRMPKVHGAVGHRGASVPTPLYIYTHIYVYIHIYEYICICMYIYTHFYENHKDFYENHKDFYEKKQDFYEKHKDFYENHQDFYENHKDFYRNYKDFN